MTGEAKLMPICTAMVGENSNLFPRVLELHVPRGSIVADVIFGNGVFWKNIPPGRYILLDTDIQNGIDLRSLPYEDAFIDALVLDPPYRSHGNNLSSSLKMMEKCYKLSTVYGRKQVRELYIKGAAEAYRVLKDDAILIVKCQDEVCGKQQFWNHIEILQELELLGFKCIDLFVLVRKSGVIVKRKQFHAAKNHSYFLVFSKGKGLRPDGYTPNTHSLLEFVTDQETV